MRIVSLVAALLLTGAAGAASAAAPDQAAFDRGVAAAKAEMMTDPGKALGHAQALLAAASQLPLSRQAQIDHATAQWLQAEALIFLNQNDRAAPIVEAAVRTVAQIAPGTKLEGDLMRSRGAIAAAGGHVHEALEAYQRAFEIFSVAHEARGEALALQDLGEIYWEAGDYERVLSYYAQSAELYDKDPALRLTTHNNRGEVLRKLNRPADARKEYAAALADARKLGSPTLILQVLSNLADAEVEAGDLAAAQATLRSTSGLAQSGEAAVWRPFLAGVSAKIAARQGNWPAAGADLDRMFAGVDLSHTDMNYKPFHELASDVYAHLGNTVLALAHFKAFHRLDSDARNLIATTSSQLLSARFDFANQKMRISQLKQAQLQGEVQLERQRSRLRDVVLSGALGAGGLVLVVALFGFFSVRRSRNKVRAANVELRHVNDKLEKALTAKTEFLATTSHEIRTPLNGILGMTQILLADARLDEAVRDKVEVVHGAGETMKALVDDILDIAKMETGRVSVDHERTDLTRVLEDVVRLWSGHARNKGLQLRLVADGTPSAIMSDEGRLRQIVSNLLSNAVKFTEQGWVELAARVEHGAEGGEELAISVTDSGIGIPEDQHAAIFEPFHQVDGGTTRQFSGTGLGLAIVRRLALALGGDVTLVSAPGYGSTFTLRFPLERPTEETAVEARHGARPRTLSEAAVMVVQGNALTQGVMRALLEPAVGSVALVADGDTALASLGRADHLLIEASSAAMAGHDIIGSLAELITRATEAGVPTTVLFAPSETLPMAAIVGLGASQLVIKPVGGAALLATMAELYITETPAQSSDALAA